MLDVDRFGNLGLNVTAEEIAALGVGHGDQVEVGLALTPYFAVVAETYADASRGELILYEDSYGHWAIAINGGSAAALTETASATKSASGRSRRARPGPNLAPDVSERARSAAFREAIRAV